MLEYKRDDWPIVPWPKTKMSFSRSIWAETRSRAPRSLPPRHSLIPQALASVGASQEYPWPLAAIVTAIPSPSYARAFADTKLPTTPAFSEADVSDKPPNVARRPSLDDAAKNHIEASYRAELQSLQSVDDLVGAVVDELQATGKLDNTVIIYTSDNGYEYGEHRLAGKISVYEGSIKVTLVMKGPGIPKN